MTAGATMAAAGIAGNNDSGRRDEGLDLGWLWGRDLGMIEMEAVEDTEEMQETQRQTTETRDNGKGGALEIRDNGDGIQGRSWIQAADDRVGVD